MRRSRALKYRKIIFKVNYWVISHFFIIFAGKMELAPYGPST